MVSKFRENCSQIWQKLSEIFAKIGLENYVGFVAIIVYSLLGGVIFRACEQSADLKQKLQALEDLNATTAEFSQQFLKLCKSELIHPHYLQNLRVTQEAVLEFSRKLGQSYDTPSSSWDLLGSTFYAATLYTTIGYGNLYPQTTAGRIMTIIYSLIGIPLMLILLAQWGKSLFSLMRLVWFKWIMVAHICLACWRKTWHKLAQMTAVEEEEPENVPSLMALAIMFIWILSCAGMFLAFERQWSLLKSFFFFYISLTTIGLGDIVPSETRYSLLALPMIMAGLSVVSMCISIMQTNLEALFQKMLQEIDSEYKTAQTAGNLKEMGDTSAHLGLYGLAKNKTAKDRLLYVMMGESQKKQLEQKWEKVSNMRNKITQTGVVTSTQAIQAGSGGLSEMSDLLAFSGGAEEPSRFTRTGGRKSYIYSVTD